MRYVLIFWAAPMSLFWGWYYLSFNDINFGMLFFSRLLHDFVFEFYAHYLNQYLSMDVEAGALPGMIAEACIVDTLLIAAILAWRRRRKIADWWRARQDDRSDAFNREAIEAGREPLEG